MMIAQRANVFLVNTMCSGAATSQGGGNGTTCLFRTLILLYLIALLSHSARAAAGRAVRRRVDVAWRRRLGIVMDQPATSTALKEDEILEPEHIGSETNKMLKRMIVKLQLDQNLSTMGIPISNPIARTARYTGIHKINVQKILAFGETLPLQHIEIDRQIIQNELMHLYIVKECIPTITELFNILITMFPVYVDLDYFMRILYKMGYVFYKFPRRKNLFVMEKKSVTFERYKYLKSIQQCRKDNVPIVYIGLVSATRDIELLDLAMTLRTDTKEILNHIVFTATEMAIKNIKIIPASSYEVLKNHIRDWLLEMSILKNLPPGSVCVLEDFKIFRETLLDVPTWKSVKADMVEWLEDNNVPCDIDMPKSDLLQLIETCTNTRKNTFVIDNLLKIHNYSVLRLPQSINGLSVVALVIRFLNDKHFFVHRSSHLNIPAILCNLSEGYMKMLSDCVQKLEKQQLEHDVKIDDKLDELIEKTKTSNINEDDIGDDTEDDIVLSSFSDSD